MRFTTWRNLYFGLLLLFVFPAGAEAIPAITCHCFTDRSYDPGRPTGADPYFLATTQNSFFAAAFGVEKKSIVVKKQKGAAADDLWVAYWLAAQSGVDPEKLMQERKDKGSWRQVATSLTMSGKRVTTGVKTEVTDEELAVAVVDELLLRFRLHGKEELAGLRQAGATSQEMILAALISARSRQPATQFYHQISGGGTSWGELLQRAKIDPAKIQEEMAELVHGVPTRTGDSSNTALRDEDRDR